MKQVYVTVILVFCLQFGFGQIGFEENIVTDAASSPVGANSVYSVDIDNVADEELTDLRLLLEANLHILSDEEHMYVTYFNRYKKGIATEKLRIDRKTFRKRMGLIIGKIKAQIILSEQIDLT